MDIMKLSTSGSEEKNGKETSEKKAYRLIINAIKEKFKPGDFLLEKDLVATFKMSRTPIAMALNRLVTEGVLNRMKKKGCYIPNLDRDDAKAAFFTRSLLESAAVKKAAKLVSDDDIERLQLILSQGNKGISENDYRLFSAKDEEFHHAMVSMGKNPYLYKVWRIIYFRTNIYSRFFDSIYYGNQAFIDVRSVKSKSLQQHHQILKALIKRDPEASEKQVQTHIERSLNIILKYK